MPPSESSSSFSIAEFADLVSAALDHSHNGSGEFQIHEEFGEVLLAHDKDMDKDKDKTPNESHGLDDDLSPQPPSPSPRRTLLQSLAQSSSLVFGSTPTPVRIRASKQIDTNNTNNNKNSRSNSRAYRRFQHQTPLTTTKTNPTQNWDSNTKTTSRNMLLLTPPSGAPDPSVATSTAIVAATMSTVDLGGNCLALGGGSGSKSRGRSRSRSRGRGRNGEVNATTNRDAQLDPSSSCWMDAPQGKKTGRGKLPHISISVPGSSSASASPASTGSTQTPTPTTPTASQGLFAKIKRQLSKNNVRLPFPSPPSNPTGASSAPPTTLTFKFPEMGARDEYETSNTTRPVSYSHPMHTQGQTQTQTQTVSFAPTPEPSPTTPIFALYHAQAFGQHDSVSSLASVSSVASNNRSGDGNGNGNAPGSVFGGGPVSLRKGGLASALSLSTSATDASMSTSRGGKKQKKRRGRNERKRRARGRSGSASGSGSESSGFEVDVGPFEAVGGLGNGTFGAAAGATVAAALRKEQAEERGDEDVSSPSMYSCESASLSTATSFIDIEADPDMDAESYIGSSESFFVGLTRDERTSHPSPARLNGTKQSLEAEAEAGVDEDDSSTTHSYVPYLPLILQHERLQQRLQVSLPLSAVRAVGQKAAESRVSLVPLPSEAGQAQADERERTLSRPQSDNGSATRNSKKPKRTHVPPPLTHPAPLTRAPSPPPSPSPSPVPGSGSGSVSRARASRISTASASTASSWESKSPITPRTPFFTASEASLSGNGSVVVSFHGHENGSRSSGESLAVGVGVDGDGSVDVHGMREKVGGVVDKIDRTESPVFLTPHPFAQVYTPTRSQSPVPGQNKSRSRQNLAAAGGPVSPPPSGPLPPPPPKTASPAKSSVRRQTQTYAHGPLLAHLQTLSPQASREWPPHRHPSPFGIMSTFDSTDSVTSSRSEQESEGGVARRGSEEFYMSSSAASELEEGAEEGRNRDADSELSDLELELEFHSAASASFSGSGSGSERASEDSLPSLPHPHPHLNHLQLFKLRQTHRPTASTASADSCITSTTAAAEAAAILAANTRANAGINAAVKKIGVGRQQIERARRGSGGSAEGDGAGLEWTLCLGDAPAPAEGGSQPGVCVVGGLGAASRTRTRKPALTMKAKARAISPVVAVDSVGSFLRPQTLTVNTQNLRGRTRSESALGRTGSQGGQFGQKQREKPVREEDWTLSLPLPKPKEWAKRLSGASSASGIGEAVEGRSAEEHHSEPVTSQTGGVVSPSCADVDSDLGMDVQSLGAASSESYTSAVDSGADSGLGMGETRVEEIVLCVPRVVSSGSGMEDAVNSMHRIKSTTRTRKESGMWERQRSRSQIARDPVQVEEVEETTQDDAQVGETQEQQREEGSDEDSEGPFSAKERVKANARENLAKLDELSADLARFNEMLRSGGARLGRGPSTGGSHRQRLHSLQPPPTSPLRHSRSFGVLEVDEPPPKNAVLRMPSVEVFLKDVDADATGLDKEEEEVVTGAVPATVFSAPTAPTRTNRLSGVSMSSSTSLTSTQAQTTTTTKIRAPLPFAPPPSAFGIKPRKLEPAAASVGVSSVLASGIYGQPVGRSASASGGSLRLMPRSPSPASLAASTKLKADSRLSTATITPTSAFSPTTASSSTTQMAPSSLSVAVPASSSSSPVDRARRASTSSVISNTSTGSITPTASPISTTIPLASYFPAPPMLPPLVSAANGDENSSVTATATVKTKPQKRPSTMSSDKTILPDPQQKTRMRMETVTVMTGRKTPVREKETEMETDSMCSGSYYSARSSFSSEVR
ncbi:hypothetical protein GALMADRAFT_256596 [Galerina marginata CBS 339.88]|uniref:Uncharacterized protein n=1 Tax=Galerina marginata (strain CBS 339.88) TaxID=685588 RepID=A0A067SPP5_GALM3|nr:hypothetical protein GALMADRAFT_256596 [Galerina marginata CBS 339.88]